jgi:hypothetical protein
MSCLASFYFITGVEDEFADSYIFALSVEATVLIYVVAYILDCALQLKLNIE